MGRRGHRRYECRLEGQGTVDDLLHQNDVPPRRRQGEPAEGREVPATTRSAGAVSGEASCYTDTEHGTMVTENEGQSTEALRCACSWSVILGQSAQGCS